MEASKIKCCCPRQHGVPMDGVEDAISSTMKSKRNYLLSRPTYLYNPRLNKDTLLDSE